MLLKMEQVLDLFMGWKIDPEQPENWLRLDKGVKDTDDTVCYAYFQRKHIKIPDKPIEYDLWEFDRFEIQ